MNKRIRNKAIWYFIEQKLIEITAVVVVLLLVYGLIKLFELYGRIIYIVFGYFAIFGFGFCIGYLFWELIKSNWKLAVRRARKKK